MTDPQASWITLSGRDLRARIDPQGAQLSVLQDSTGRDLLWDGNPAVWNGRAPLLFPIVGALAGGAYRTGSSTYHLPRHGFARGRLFEALETSASDALFRLSADAASEQVYPFRFELDVRFVLQGATLSITATVRNIDSVNLPASFGYHPALRWPLPYGQPRAEHFLQFESDEPAPVRRLDAAGLLTSTLHPTPVTNRRLTLDDALFKDDVLILDQVRSRSVIYGAAAGARVRVGFPDAAYLGLWTKPGASFICIEPWHGIADPQGYSGDFEHKPGVFVVAPGDSFSTTMTLTLLPA